MISLFLIHLFIRSKDKNRNGHSENKEEQNGTKRQKKSDNEEKEIKKSRMY